MSSQNFPVVTLYVLPHVLHLPLQEEFGSVFSVYSHELVEESSKVPLPPP